LASTRKARLQSGTLEGSNVNTDRDHGRHDPDRAPVRGADALLQTAESNDRSAGQLLSLQG
jgi:hypothetical protein